MIIVYIAHPIGGDVTGNIALVEKECARIFKHKEYGVVPIAPYLFALKFLDDNDPSDRLRGVSINKEYFTRGFIDEVWLFGDRISTGMWEEVVWARELNIAVVPMTDETQLDLIRREFQIGEQIQIGVCGPGQEGVVEYLGESSKQDGWISVRGPHRDHDLPMSDIRYIAPMGVPVESPKWNFVLAT